MNNRPAYEALMKFYPLTLEDLPDELWLPVPDFDKYHVSNFGRVKSFKWSKSRIIKPVLTSRGYLRVELFKDGKPKTFLVHRLVAKAFISNPESKPFINHRDGNKLNNHVSNLEWCTSSENMRHALAAGLQKSGQDNYLAKLTNEQARLIRDNPLDLTQLQLADLFGISQGTISAIQLGLKYKQAGGSIRKPKKASSGGNQSPNPRRICLWFI